MSPERDGHEQLSLKEFCEHKGLRPLMRRGFQAHVRLNLGNFNFRSVSEWESHYATFQTADRSRRRAL